MRRSSGSCFTPLTHTYPQAKPMEFAGSKRKPPRADLREQVLKRETKRQHSQVLTELGAATNLSQEAMHLLEVQNVETAMPTDFSAFNASLKPLAGFPSRRLLIAEVTAAAWPAPRPAPAPAPARQPLPTFQDLTSARLAETSEEQRSAAAQAVLAVTRSFSLRAEERGALPDGDDASNAAAAPSTSGGQQQHQAQQPLVMGTPRAPHQLQGLAAPPADWSLKSSVRVISSVPFPGLTPTALSATRPASQACERLAPCSTSYTPGELAEAIRSALHSWQHPASPCSTEAIVEMQAGPAGRSMLQQRLLAWRAALRSLYYQLRHGACHAFYLVAQQGHKVPLTILFSAPGLRGSSRPQAVVSQSSTALRNRLARLQLQFSMPGAEKQQEQVQHQQAAVGDSGPPLPAKYDGTARSQLHLEGEAAVHGLFDLLYNEAGYSCWGEAGVDLPLLLAPVPFEGACLGQPAVQLVQGVLVMGAAGEGCADGSSGHKLEVSGLVPCWAVQRLLLALSAGGCRHFTAHLVPASASETLNKLPAGSSGGAGWVPSVLGLGGARSTAELQLWQAPASELGGGLVSEVQFTSSSGGDSRFSCRLTGSAGV